MRFAVYGTGGVGGYFGGKLAAAGYDVTFIARGEHLRAIKTAGLVVKSIYGDFTVFQAKVTDNPAEVGIVDVVLVCLKAWQVKENASSIGKLVGPLTTILPLQNGVLVTDELREVFGNQSVMRGLCRIFSKLDGYGVVNHFGIEPAVIFGEDSNERSSRALAIQEAFARAGVNAIIPNDIEAEAWKKFLFICSSGLLAVCRSTYGAVREIPETRMMLEGLLTEVYNVAVAKGVRLNPEIVTSTMKLIDTFDHGTTSSLTRDVLEGRPSELEYQNGTVVKLGKSLGVATPINSFVYSCILPSENKARNLAK